MATLILGGLGTLVGGPLGGALGALVGRQIDSAVIGTPTREGPRLKEMAITSSSHGAPIPRHFGRVRAAGTIIWATELVESRETSGGGKGRPKVATYSYTCSFAVALSSRPIDRIGRIWADGNLLRGAAGDLKVGGSMRLYPGYGDQPVDPLLAAALGAECPAFRHRAYAVFEDLQLEDFGNRIPALSFELFADDDGVAANDLFSPAMPDETAVPWLEGLLGISHEGGSLADFLLPAVELYPTALDAADRDLRAIPTGPGGPSSPLLGEPVVAESGDSFGRRGGIAPTRRSVASATSGAIRYYDIDRDYQPGIQRRPGGGDGDGSRIVEFPATLNAASARALIGGLAARQRSRREAMRWRVAELDPTIAPGSVIRLPGFAGTWLVEDWEWRSEGIELALARLAAPIVPGPAGDPGFAPAPPDRIPAPSLLRVLELPWDGTGAPNGRQVFAALASQSPDRAGTALYAQRQGQLERLGTGGRTQSTFGRLETALGPSPALLLEAEASIEIATAVPSMAFASTDIDGLAAGRNRIMIGTELVQFLCAEQLGERLWRLYGLLRGRGGTEPAASRGHSADTPVTLIDETLVALGEALALDGPETAIAAIGRGDSEPVYASVENQGLGARPLMPIHAVAEALPGGDLSLRWTRRSRGAWLWSDGFEIPLNEDVERYRVGIGPLTDPLAEWFVEEARLTVPAAMIALHSGQPAWVCQLGRSEASEALFLTLL